MPKFDVTIQASYHLTVEAANEEDAKYVACQADFDDLDPEFHEGSEDVEASNWSPGMEFWGPDDDGHIVKHRRGAL